MKRSEINAIINDFKSLIEHNQIYLPPFAYWTPADWQNKGEEVYEIYETGMGWDITDWGNGNFREAGLALFTLRNGLPANLEKKQGKFYAEKLLVAGVNQVTPMHYHAIKMEDIINRGGGKLAIQLYNSKPDGSLDDTPVVVSIDGIKEELKAGSIIQLQPGESITLTQYLYHKFWGVGSRVMIGEVSLSNDDDADNFFYGKIGRFPKITEDVPPVHLLTKDYANYYRFAKK
ncbi:MAG TPA: D-lyxose/D-mannose family sugar isomerase [Firmicutes bacterium]|jgi:D-lyxose ketol-isomerase|nr:D-lyxose/D-mannose family sugar isomerase [Bacillota bacterium]